MRYFTGHPSDAIFVINVDGKCILSPWDENLAKERAEKYGIKLITAGGLPAKTAPVTAAKIIFMTINNILREHF